MKAELAGCLTELEQRGLLPADRLAVFCVGSVARGWANETSDYDIYLVTRSPWQSGTARTIPVPLLPAVVPTVTLFVEGRRWELKYWLDSQVDQMLAKVSWQQFEDDTTTARSLTVFEELFLEKLLTCLPLGGEDWVRGRVAELEASAFRAFVTTRSLAEADDAVEDALGQLAAQDVDSAVLSARKAIGHVVDALMESQGNYGSRTPKWRARRFRDAPPAQIGYQEYWDLETMRDFDPAAPHAWVNRVVERCKDLSLEVEIR